MEGGRGARQTQAEALSPTLFGRMPGSLRKRTYLTLCVGDQS